MQPMRFRIGPTLHYITVPSPSRETSSPFRNSMAVPIDCWCIPIRLTSPSWWGSSGVKGCLIPSPSIYLGLAFTGIDNLHPCFTAAFLARHGGPITPPDSFRGRRHSLPLSRRRSIRTRSLPSLSHPILNPIHHWHLLQFHSSTNQSQSQSQSYSLPFPSRFVPAIIPLPLLSTFHHHPLFTPRSPPQCLARPSPHAGALQYMALLVAVSQPEPQAIFRGSRADNSSLTDPWSPRKSARRSPPWMGVSQPASLTTRSCVVLSIETSSLGTVKMRSRVRGSLRITTDWSGSGLGLGSSWGRHKADRSRMFPLPFNSLIDLSHQP